MRTKCVDDVGSPEIIQRNDGRWSIGLQDDGPGFETRGFALRVASGLEPTPAPVANWIKGVRHARST
jgi:hypothetical protein